jgi:hypothetical protein
MRYPLALLLSLFALSAEAQIRPGGGGGGGAVSSVTAGTGLTLTAGTLSCAQTTGSTFGCIKVTAGHGLTLASGVIGLDLATGASDGALAASGSQSVGGTHVWTGSTDFAAASTVTVRNGLTMLSDVYFNAVAADSGTTTRLSPNARWVNQYWTGSATHDAGFMTYVSQGSAAALKSKWCLENYESPYTDVFCIDQALSNRATFTGAVYGVGIDAGSQLGTHFLTPVSSTDAATKGYVDGALVVTAVTAANGLTLTTGTLAMGAAGIASAGAVTTGSQVFSGGKTFQDPMTLNSTLNSASTGSFIGMDAGSQKITAVATPTVSTDAATKGYVDGLAPSRLVLTPSIGYWRQGSGIASTSLTGYGMTSPSTNGATVAVSSTAGEGTWIKFTTDTTANSRGGVNSNGQAYAGTVKRYFARIKLGASADIDSNQRTWLGLSSALLNSQTTPTQRARFRLSL